MDDIVKDFLVEGHEILDQLDSNLLALEERPNDHALVADIFRVVHTLKGSAGFLAFSKLENVTHAGENLLALLRDGELVLTADVANGLLCMVDTIRKMLDVIEATGQDGDDDFAELLAQLDRLKVARGTNSENVPAVAEASGADEGTQIEEPHRAIPSAAVDAPAPQVDAPPALSKELSPIADTTVRLDVQLLDRLMNLVGELVLARNQILQFTESTRDASLFAASQRLNLITTELQEGVMKTRMQPIRNAWSKIPRIVRDLATTCGKQVEVRMSGEETELDKTILEAIRDPLTHIVRNSIDHGLEPADEREANGKSRVGSLRLKAFHEGGQVNIEISDDGRGIDLKRVSEQAVAKGLVSQSQVAKMTDRELTNLILLPGFSTAAKVTNVSGRGVGMDVVKNNVERIGGTLDIQSYRGQGTTLRIKIPLTLAIVPALIVTTAEDRYAIPQVSLLELVRLEEGRAKREIEFVHEAPVYRLRGKLLPLVYLDEQLKTRQRVKSTSDDRAINIVVLQADDRQFGLVVDEINDTQEIVVKPLGRHLKGIIAYAGATIMGDGSVALILDVLGLAQQGNVVSEQRERSIRKEDASFYESSDEGVSLLLVDPGDGTQAAIPLDRVSRLEEFETSRIEKAGHLPVVQYRGKIMPIIGVDGSRSLGAVARPTIHVVVVQADGADVGVVVGAISDIVVDSDFSMNDCERIIGGRVTRVVDLESLVGPFGTCESLAAV